MNDIILNLIVIAVFGIIAGVGVIIYLQRKKQIELQFLQDISQRGWQYESIHSGHTSGYRVKGIKSNIPWILEATSENNNSEAGPGSSEVSHHTHWVCSEIRLNGGMVVIGPGTLGSSITTIGGLDSPLVQKALRLMIGDEAQPIEHLEIVETGERKIQQHYTILSQSQQDAHRLLSNTVENLLLSFPETLTPVIIFNKQGMKINIRGQHLKKIEDINLLIELGDTLVNAWKFA